MQIGVVGLGNMGRNLALNMQEHGHEVFGWNRSEAGREKARQDGVANVTETLQDLVTKLTPPRAVWCMVSTEAVDSLFFDEGGLMGLLGGGDVVIDGANSHFEETKRRAERLAAKGISLLDCGVSGGVAGARTGACLMVGGSKSAFDHVEPIFKSTAIEGGYAYLGPSGAGHFVKMVHNGVEYGMMQSLAEGLNIIRRSSGTVSADIQTLAQVWNHGSIIESKLLSFVQQALAQDPNLSSSPPEVGSLGTGQWLVDFANKYHYPVPAIQAAVSIREQATPQQDEEIFMFKLLQALRSLFGGHTSKDRPSH